MTKLSISVAAPLDSLDACVFLHRRLGMALSSAKRRLAMGPAGLFYTTELFMNDHVEKDPEICDILEWFGARDIKLYIIMLPEEKTWQDFVTFEDLSVHREPEQYLINLLDRARGEYR